MSNERDSNKWSMDMTLKTAKIQSRRAAGGHEKRVRPRLPFLRKVRVWNEQAVGGHGPEIECQGSNLSQSGMGLRSPMAFAQGHVIRIEAAITADANMVLRGVVRMCKPRPDGTFTVGVEFLADSALNGKPSSNAA